MRTTSFYIDSQGARVLQAQATARRFRCECGEHQWDVLIEDDDGDVTTEMIEAYAAVAHGGDPVARAPSAETDS